MPLLRSKRVWVYKRVKWTLDTVLQESAQVPDRTLKKKVGSEKDDGGGDKGRQQMLFISLITERLLSGPMRAHGGPLDTQPRKP